MSNTTTPPSPQHYATIDGEEFEIIVIVKRCYVWDKQAKKHFYSSTDLWLHYEGYLEDLLSTRIIGKHMARPPGKGHHYTDPDGRNVNIARRWKVEEGEPQQFLTVGRAICIGELNRWPGAAEALRANEEWQVWKARRLALLSGSSPQPYEPIQVPTSPQPALAAEDDETAIPAAVQHQVEQLLRRFTRGPDPDNTPEVRP